MPNDYVFGVSAQDLKTQICGNNNGTLVPVAADSAGNLNVSLDGVLTSSSNVTITAGGTGVTLTADTSQQRFVSYYVNNSPGDAALTVWLQVSPIDDPDSSPTTPRHRPPYPPAAWPC